MKRGQSGLCLVLGVNKPSGITSHDVVSGIRRIFGEKRVGHAGTLDPLATGVLPILVGSATRLDRFMVGHDKSYIADIVFGTSTSTDDSEGEVLRTAPVPDNVGCEEFAQSVLSSFIGKQTQVPPAYSAIKVNGKKAYSEARKGNIVHLEPRDIEVYDASLVEIGNIGDLVFSDSGQQINSNPKMPHGGSPFWRVSFHVSKGTYIRALARDIGKSVGCEAHLGGLLRDRVGLISLDSCYSLEEVESLGVKCAIDPLKVLELKILFVDEASAKAVANGSRIPADGLRFFEYPSSALEQEDSCTSSLLTADGPLPNGSQVAVTRENMLLAIYEYDEKMQLLKPSCVFAEGVKRGFDI